MELVDRLSEYKPGYEFNITAFELLSSINVGVAGFLIGYVALYWLQENTGLISEKLVFPGAVVAGLLGSIAGFALGHNLEQVVLTG